jgi:hypothetical protein
MPIAANVLISGRLAIFPSWFPIEKRYYFQTQQEAKALDLTRKQNYLVRDTI